MNSFAFFFGSPHTAGVGCKAKIKLLRSDLSELSLSFSTPQNLQDTKFVGLYRYRKSALDHYFVIERNYTQNIIDKHLIQYLN